MNSMNSMNSMNARRTRACATLLASLFPWCALAQPAGVDAKADTVFRAMTTYMAGLKHFRAQTENAIEIVTTDAQIIQFMSPATITVSRPDRFLAERRDHLVDQSFYYDGKSLTLYSPATKHYATVAAPGTVDATLEFAASKLDVIAPAGDLVNTRAYQLLMQDAKAGIYVGLEMVGGERCHHLAYRATEVDWQLWVHEGDRPYPCRYVITSKTVAGAPQFSVQIVKFDPSPKISASMFRFVPPAGAKAVEFLPLSQSR
jgi:hypothetical protein